MIDPDGLLMIEPTTPSSSEPVLDELTLRTAAIWRECKGDRRFYKGVHRCICGAESGNQDYHFFPPTEEESMVLTNSLCVHYVAYHRDAVTEEEALKIIGLSDSLCWIHETAGKVIKNLPTPRLPHGQQKQESVRRRASQAVRRILNRPTATARGGAPRVGEEVTFIANDTYRSIKELRRRLKAFESDLVDPRIKAIVLTKLQEAELFSLLLINKE